MNIEATSVFEKMRQSSARPDTLVLNPANYYWLLASAWAPINWNALHKRWSKTARRLRMRRKKHRGWA